MPNTNTLTELFEDIADAIRAKDGTSASITATDFPAKIMAIPSGGGGGGYTKAFTGTIDYLDYNGNWDDVIADSSNTFTTSDLESMQAAFDTSQLTSIPFTFNFKTTGGLSNPTITTNSAFRAAKKLTSLDLGNQTMYWKPGQPTAQTFMGCHNLRTINAPNVVTYGGNSMFNTCCSLRELPFRLRTGYSSSVTYHPYKTAFQNCYALNKVENLGVHTSTANANLFTNTFYGCGHLMKITFDNPGGVAISSSMKNQTIDLSASVGYAGGPNYFLGYNSGITADKEVTDATSYNALKNDPDWFTTDPAYSRYNHDSAVETINSLPDTSVSSGSTGNIIKFLGTAGSATDGGAINTLTAAEIAVATAKGWTVTLV